MVNRDEFGRYLGGFFPDGNWNKDGDWCSPQDWFLRRLLTARRTAQHSPAWFAAVIRATEGGRFVGCIGEPALRIWDQIDDWEMWSCAPCPTGWAENLKRCGLGGQVQGDWAGGWWMQKDHPRLAEWHEIQRRAGPGMAEASDG